MKRNKLMLPVLAVIVGVAASAFTTTRPNSKATNLSDTWYQYDGPAQQTIQDRETASNYIKISADPLCNTSNNECAVELNQDFGNTPNFSNVSFDSNGFPNGGSSFVKNEQQN